MPKETKALKNLRQEFLEFKRTMKEMQFLRLIAEDLRTFREMIKTKKYD